MALLEAEPPKDHGTAWPTSPTVQCLDTDWRRLTGHQQGLRERIKERRRRVRIGCKRRSGLRVSGVILESRCVDRLLLQLYLLHDYNAEAAASYLNALRESRGGEAAPVEEARRYVEDIFLEQSGNDIAELVEAMLNDDDARAAKAKNTYLEWHLMDWTRKQNGGNGVAPTAPMLLRQLHVLVTDSFQWHESYSRGLDTDQRNRTYLWRWRKFWRGRFRRVRTREDIPAAEVREKAWGATAGSFRVTFWAPKSGPRRGPLF